MEQDPRDEARRLWTQLGSKAKRALAQRDRRYIEEWLGGLSHATRAEVLAMCDKYAADWRTRIGSPS